MSSERVGTKAANQDSAPEPIGASQRVYLGIMQDLEARRIAPGQRLIETDLAQRFGVGRNAVREAIQRLASRGTVDPSRNKSPAIRILDLAETHEILDVAAAMTSLASRAAALAFNADKHAAMLDEAMRLLSNIGVHSEADHFSKARRQFYRAILKIGSNRELLRLFPAIAMHIIYSQYQSRRLQQIRMTDYSAIRDAIVAGDASAAERAAQRHVEHFRSLLPPPVV